MAQTSEPCSVRDVAELILSRAGEQQPMKLQKLVYYTQVWSVVQNGKPAFTEKLIAWIHGPVVTELYQLSAGSGAPVATVGGRPERVPPMCAVVVDQVLLYYGRLGASTLRSLTHAEDPWRRARGSLAENEPSTAEITLDSIRQFYSGRPMGRARPVTDFSVFSTKNVERSRDELQRGRYVTLDEFERGVPSPHP